MRRHAIILPYDHRVKYSINAITAVLDTLRYCDVYLIEGFGRLIKTVKVLERKYSKIIVGVSLNTIMLTDNEVLNTILTLNKIKGPNTLSVVGGPHATGDPIGCIDRLGFDYVVIGEGEETVKELVDTIIFDGDVRKVRGLFFKDNDRHIFTGRRSPINLDSYHPFPYWRNLWGAIEITRGCPYGCFYCQVSYMHGFKPRHRSIESIVRYADLMARHGLKDVRFITPNSLGYGTTARCEGPRIEVIEELLESLHEVVVKRHGGRIFFGTFPSEVRPEYLTDDAARILRKYVANKNIIIGAQTGSDRLLKIINRGHSIEDVFNAVEAARKHGFTPDVDFILGLPGETREDLEETIKVMEKLVSMGARIHLHVFMPLPGSPFGPMPPGRVPDWVKKRVAKLIGRGGAYGQWLAQERIAEKINELRVKGIISYPCLKTNVSRYDVE